MQLVRRAGLKRSLVWALVLALLCSLLVLLIWLVGRYEASQAQDQLDQDAIEAVADIRSGLARNIQSLSALPAGTGVALSSGQSRSEAWEGAATSLLQERRELVRIELRSATLTQLGQANTPFRANLIERFQRGAGQTDLALTCASASRLNGAAYAPSYFVPLGNGLGTELLDVCLPQTVGGALSGYVVATYAMQELLSELVSPKVARGHRLSLTEPDGTRLAMLGFAVRGSSRFSQHLLDLPGTAIMLRLDSRRSAQDVLFPNALTALVVGLALALFSLLFLLARDMRRRLKVEGDLGEALAFRKAMEDSLITGLRARDLNGRITYVNPAFCHMVGMSAPDLLGQNLPAPYWPPELASTYQQRQTVRLAELAGLAGADRQAARESHESVFIRADGTRFPVLIMEAPLVNAVGKHTGWMSAILDVSEQRRVEERSRASQDRLQATARLAMVGEMASLLSHELNQPLAAISSYAVGSLNLLAQSRTGPPDALASDLDLGLRRIAEQAERAGKVIKSVHDFVRRREQERAAAAPSALIEAVMPLVGLQAKKLGLNVVVEVAADVQEVLCDRTMVEQVLLNLARNGMQAMQDFPPPGGAAATLRLAARNVPPEPGDALAPRWVAFEVTDEGAGISEDTAAQLFTPFFTTRAEGMGLGLSLCRTVIEQHGGTLSYAPSTPRGTVFRFTLAASPNLLASPLKSSHATTS